MNAKRYHWPVKSFGEIVEERAPAAVGKRRTTYRRELHRRLGVFLTYEGFRQMLDGTLEPRYDVMEAVAELLGMDAREFPEYRLWQIGQVLVKYPEEADGLYEAAMVIARKKERAARG